MSNNVKTYIEIDDLTVGYKQNHTSFSLIEKFSTKISRPQVISILGANGAGKSTLIRTLTGLLPPVTGNINIFNKDIKELKGNNKARLISYVAASSNLPGNLFVKELINFGRYPYSGLLKKEDKEDKEKQRNAMRQMQINHLANRQLNEISDGERQRAMIARAISQDTPIIILDEPSAHLDIKNKYELMRFLRKQADNFGKLIIFSSHDLDVIINNSDIIWMIDNKNIVSGMPEDLIINNKINNIVPSDEISFDKETGKFTMPVKLKSTVCLQGNSIITKWTKHALKRYGFKTECNKKGNINVSIFEENNSNIWLLTYKDQNYYNYSINELIQNIKKLKL